MKTKDLKLKIGDTTYVFRVPFTTSLDPADIIKADRIMMVRVSAMVIKDVFGTPLGKHGRAWNCRPVIEVPKNGEIEKLLFYAIQKTKNLIEAERKHPNTTILPKLSITHHRGKVIDISDEEPRYYFIESVSYCDNCKEPIKGITKLEINENGKIAKELPFSPTEPANKHPMKDKWLHEDCYTKSILGAEPVRVQNKQEQEQFIKNDKILIKIDKIPIIEPVINPHEKLVEILQRQDLYSAEFARGAAVMYNYFKKG